MNITSLLLLVVANIHKHVLGINVESEGFGDAQVLGDTYASIFMCMGMNIVSLNLIDHMSSYVIHLLIFALVAFHDLTMHIRLLLYYNYII